MEFTMHQNSLKQTLDNVVGVLPVKSPMPALDCIRLRIEDGKARVTATDLNTWLLAMTGCSSKGTKTEFLVPGRKLYEIVNLLPEEEISFELKDNKINLKCSNVKHHISTISVKDYPSEQCLYKKDSGYISLPKDGFQAGLEAISFACAKEDTSPISGVSFNLTKDKLKLAATDSHRLAAYLLPVTSNVEKNLVIPSYVAKHIGKMEGNEIRLFLDKNLIGFYAENLGITSRLLEGEFPPYESIIPKDNDKKLIANRKELINAIRQIEVFAKDNHDIIQVNVSKKDGLTLSTKGEGFDSEACVKCKYQGDSIKVGVNAKYLLQNLQSSLTEEIEWSFKTPVSAMVIRKVPKENKDNFYLLMPVKLDTL